jgi:2-oxoglutarate ferredoxin oxidoreductase subunit delta
LEVREMDKRDVKAGEIDNEKLVIKPAWCKGCGICVAFCPTKTLTLENEKVKIVDINKCTQCGMCELRCPDYAIYLGRKKNEKQG